MLAPLRLALALALVACTGSRRPPREAPTPMQAPKVLTNPRPLPARPPPRFVPFDKVQGDPRAARLLRDNLSLDPVVLDQRPPPELTTAALEDTAHGEARGLELVDAIHVADLDETRRAVIALPVTLGDCITVIAHGGLGVMEVDAFLAEHASSPLEIVAEDGRAGPIAVIGGLRGCYPFLGREPATLDVIVQARKGGGPVVFAVYRGRP